MVCFWFEQRAKYDSGDYDSDLSDKDEELPQVVVVNTGDLTADEAEREKQRLDLGMTQNGLARME